MNSRTHGKSSAASKGTNMKRRLIHSLLCAVCAAAPLALPLAAPAQAQGVMRPASDLVVSVGRGQLVNTGGAMSDVFVANEEIADVQVKSQRQLYVFGKASGETTVYASNAAGDVVWSANVRVGSNIDSVDQMLRLAMPDAKVSVTTIGSNTFLLTGTVASPEDAAEAQRLVKAFVEGKDSKANVISRLRMATPLQVNLLVRFAEVSRSLVREINSNITTRDLTGGFTFGLHAAAIRARSAKSIRRECRSSTLRRSSTCRRTRSGCHSIRRPAGLLSAARPIPSIPIPPALRRSALPESCSASTCSARSIWARRSAW